MDQGSFTELAAKAASACTKLVAENCSLCTVYCDKQVQYESVLEQYKMTSSLDQLFNKLDDNSLEVQEFRDRLFDEESVVKQAKSRQEDD